MHLLYLSYNIVSFAEKNLVLSSGYFNPHLKLMILGIALLRTVLCRDSNVVVCIVYIYTMLLYIYLDGQKREIVLVVKKLLSIKKKEKEIYYFIQKENV